MKPTRFDDPEAVGDDDPRLVTAVREYLAAVEAGRRPDVAELLAKNHDIAESLLACIQGLAFVNTAAAQLNAAAPDLGIPQPLGDFQLIREIGRGGMGVVYEARQLSLGRRVAVKVLSLGAALDPNHLQRFRNEAQAAAQLHHTNIVPVYAIGCDRSVHFYAMQLIEGQSLSDVIDELRSGSAEGTMPSSELSTLRLRRRTDFFRTAAQLALQAAEALDYAHRLGVVHRDIKPANLMIDRRGNLWITDFGLAHFYDDTGLTRTGDMLGTLRYMSPEQASGRATVLDQRTDIYSLGMTLYELLTLQRALPGATRQELIFQIGMVEPTLPRNVDKSIPVELQTILMKAIAKEPAERYANARALADDLRRYLDDQPILARPPSALDQCVKWTRRHKTLARSIAVMIVISLIGFAISTVLIARQAAKTKTAYDLEHQKAEEAYQQRLLAEKNFNLARQAVYVLTEVAADELPHDPQFSDARKHLLEVALDYYQTFIDQSTTDPSLGAELTAARQHAFSILTELSAVDEAGRIMFDRHLLDDESVQRDLGLSNDQLNNIEKLRDGMGPMGGPPGFHGGGSGPDHMPPPEPGGGPRSSPEQWASQAGPVKTAIASILTPAQVERLKEISRRLRGISAFSDSDVQQALALTDSQEDSIRKIRSQFGDRMGNHRGGPPDRGPGGPDNFPPPGPRPDDNAAMNQILKLLTPSQQAAWQSLIGKPFTMDQSPWMRPPGDGGFMHFEFPPPNP